MAQSQSSTSLARQTDRIEYTRWTRSGRFIRAVPNTLNYCETRKKRKFPTGQPLLHYHHQTFVATESEQLTRKIRRNETTISANIEPNCIQDRKSYRETKSILMKSLSLYLLEIPIRRSSHYVINSDINRMTSCTTKEINTRHTLSYNYWRRPC